MSGEAKPNSLTGIFFVVIRVLHVPDLGPELVE
jgi:hypothetical protein